MRTLRLMLALATLSMLADGVAAQSTGAPMLEQMTWDEVRDAIKAGKTTIIIPIGGTEQNGPHMVLGKHNYIVTFAAKLMAERLGNTLVAPTIQYVPEGNYNSPNFGQKPGVISNPSPSYDNLLDAAARSLKVHGFTDILFIGDSGGNQAGMTNVANKLNAEWQGQGPRVYALNEYYSKARDDFRAWLLAQYGYDAATVGSHAGISDTSQMLYVLPGGIRKDRIKPLGGGPDSGVSGDPTKATAEIGKMGIDFKVNAGIAQYKTLKANALKAAR
jgi:creatinine amidohydrolase